jgi:hypothetical protein
VDRRLRERERAWHVCGDRDERVGLLQEARRRGDPAAEQALALAAYVGQPAAREALGLPQRVRCGNLAGCVIDLESAGGDEVRGDHDRECPLPSLFNFERYAQDLAGFGPETEVRAALAAARRTLEWWDSLQGWEAIEREGVAHLERRHYLCWSDAERHLRPRRLLDAVERWILEPTPARQRAVDACAPVASDERPFAFLVDLPQRFVEQGEEGSGFKTLLACSEFLPEERLVRQEVREALIPWALDELDPLLGIARLAEA